MKKNDTVEFAEAAKIERPAFFKKAEVRGSKGTAMERQGITTPGNYRGRGFRESNRWSFHEKEGASLYCENTKKDDKKRLHVQLRACDNISIATAVDMCQGEALSEKMTAIAHGYTWAEEHRRQRQLEEMNDPSAPLRQQPKKPTHMSEGFEKEDDIGLFDDSAQTLCQQLDNVEMDDDAHQGCAPTYEINWDTLGGAAGRNLLQQNALGLYGSKYMSQDAWYESHVA